MRLSWGRAILAGLVATLVMTLIMNAGRFVGVELNMPGVLGAMFGPPSENLTLGYTLHFGMGVVFAIAYALVFTVVGRAGAEGGAILGLVHGLVAGVMLGILPIMHPNMGPGEAIAPPGFFALNLGAMAAIMVIVGHVIWGTIVGVIERVPIQPAPEARSHP